MPISCRQKTLFLGVFLDEISFLGQTVDFCLQHVIYIWKAMTLSYKLAYQEIILVRPTRRQMFAGKPYSTFWNILDLIVYSPLCANMPYALKLSETMPALDNGST